MECAGQHAAPGTGDLRHVRHVGATLTPLQIAIAKFFDGEGPDLVAEALAVEAARFPQTAARHEVLQESFLDADVHAVEAARRPQTEIAPRVLPPTSVVYSTPLFVGILFVPLRFGYKVVAGIFNSIIYLLSFFPRPIRPRFVLNPVYTGLRQTRGRRVTLPKETAQRFKRDFEEEYGRHDLVFFEGGHAQALDTAKDEVKFLLTVLVAPEHDDTEPFMHHTLLSPEVADFINDPSNNIIVWGGNVLDPEAYQVAREYNATTYPFSCLACLTPQEGSSRMGIVKRMVGPMTIEEYLANLQSAIEKNAPELAAVRADRAATEMARTLRSEQDSAYERSLAVDRERARQKREAAAAAAEAEKRALEEAEAAARLVEQRQQWREWRANTMAPEPDASVKEAVRLAFNMPASSASGAGRVVRKFAPQTTLEELYAFVECHDLLQEGVAEKGVEQPEDYEHVYGFRISSLIPRETLEPSKTVTVGAKLGRGGNLVVESLSAEDDEDDEE